MKHAKTLVSVKHGGWLYEICSSEVGRKVLSAGKSVDGTVFFSQTFSVPTSLLDEYVALRAREVLAKLDGELDPAALKISREVLGCLAQPSTDEANADLLRSAEDMAEALESRDGPPSPAAARFRKAQFDPSKLPGQSKEAQKAAVAALEKQAAQRGQLLMLRGEMFSFVEKNCRACKHSLMEPDDDLACGHPDAGSVGTYAYIAAGPSGHCGAERPKFEQHPLRHPDGELK